MIETRLLERGDVEAFSRFIFEAWRQAGPGALGWTGASEEQIQALASTPFVESLLEREGTRLMVAVDGENVVGFSSNKRVDNSLVELSGIVVLERLIGGGIGSRLLDAALKVATLDGYVKMVVRAEVWNERAIGFYERNGFMPVRQETMDVNESKVRVLVLERILNQIGRPPK